MTFWVAGAWYALCSLVAAAMYAWDKRRARCGGRRIPESRLHAVAVIGGWPGAILARRLLHHKSRQRRFGLILWASAALHVGALIVLIVARR